MPGANPEQAALDAAAKLKLEADEAARKLAAEAGDDPDDLEESDDDDDTVELTPEQLKAALKKARAENAKRRTAGKELSGKATAAEAKLNAMKKALGMETDEKSPEDVIAELKANNEALQLEHSLTQLAIEHDVPKEQSKYFRFLLSEKFATLEEGEEISEEDLEEVLAEMKKAPGAQAANSSTGLNGAGKNRLPGKGDDITVEKFAAMSLSERTEVYVKNQALYNQLFEAARSKRLLK